MGTITSVNYAEQINQTTAEMKVKARTQLKANAKNSTVEGFM